MKKYTDEELLSVLKDYYMQIQLVKEGKVDASTIIPEVYFFST